jgi:hypothetical protein
MRRLILVLALLLAGCNGNPAAPSGTPQNQPPPPTLHTLTGIVQSAATGPLGGATVTVTDGPNVGKSAITAGDGRYTLTDLTFAGFSVSVAAADHVGVSRGVTLSGSGTTTTVNVSLLPSAIWTRSGKGNAVFDMPTYVSRVRITGTTSSSCQNFAVRVAGRLLVNVILGTCSIADSRNYTGTHLTTGGTVETVISTGIAWTFTEVR